MSITVKISQMEELDKKTVFATSKGTNITLVRLTSSTSSKFREALAPIKESLTEDNFHAYWENFALESNIHGVKEIYKAKTQLSRFFWISIWFICVSAAVYEIFQVIRDHQADNTATKVSVIPSDSLEYPDVLVCPVKWISKREMKRLNVSQDQLAFALSLLQTEFTINRRRLQVANETETELEMSEFLKLHNMSTYAEFYKAISFRSKSLFDRRVPCNSRDLLEADTIATLSGICYGIKFCSRSSENELSPRLRYIPPAEDIYDVPVVSNGVFISLHNPESQISRLLSHQLFLVPGRPVQANLDLTVSTRINHGGYECESSRDIRGYVRSRSECNLACVDDWLFKATSNCSVLSIFTPNSPYKQCKHDHAKHHSDLLSKEEAVESRVRVQQCLSQCKPQCMEKFYNAMSVLVLAAVNQTEYFGTNADIYEVQTQPIPLSIDHWFCLAFQFRMSYNSFRYVLFEDVDTTLSLDTLISLIGGEGEMVEGIGIEPH